ncbi:olfactory receptor 11A1-like [Carettochelys insculpta]|uniref:olfactory receptor 11A1-like n=1 Tax=Carettochelys insculpta TaxID=44489 RepID=UPI003EB6C578
MADTDWINRTSLEFILLGFGSLPALQVLLFLLFSVIYMVTMAGNSLIIVLVVIDQRLHTPMYFFLGNLSFLETCYSSTILPRLLASLLTGDRSISFSGCMGQFYTFGVLVTAECFLLSVMSYDRYLAICKPLHYGARMNGRFCALLVAGSWTSGILAITMTTSLMFQLPFCHPGNIDHFFCDFTPVVKLSCSDTRPIELWVFVLSAVCSLPPFLLTITSYVWIISTILQIPSTTDRQKAFSTCSSHLTVVTTFYGTLIIVYLLPKTQRLRELNKLFSVFYTVLTPLVNPLVYSLRNKEVKKALRKAAHKCLGCTAI